MVHRNGVSHHTEIQRVAGCQELRSVGHFTHVLTEVNDSVISSHC